MNVRKYQNPPRRFRAAPFWSWNDRLDPEQLREQVRGMAEAGLGGYFMHARSGLSTEYMSEDWMEAFRACIGEGRRYGMLSWGYDEEGYPSGFAGGRVQEADPKNCMKWLERTVTEHFEPGSDVIALYDEDGTLLPTDQPLARPGMTCLRLCTNAGYVDTMDPDVVKTFLDLTHEKYYARFGDAFGREMPGFFTDEPQYGESGIPWSNVLPDEYRKAYGTDVTECLFHLYRTDEAGYPYRHRFWKLVNRLFSENFAGQIGAWCTSHGCKLTGHLMCEDDLMCQMRANAGVMPAYRHFGIPGMDWLGRRIGSDMLPKQVSSVAAQTGKRQTLSEMYALCGWDVTPEELKWIAEWQYVGGISYMCQHLAAYSLRGLRKRDHPAALSCQMPWWPEYRYFNDYFGRLSMLLTEGKEDCPVLLLHSITSSWLTYGMGDFSQILPYQASMEDVLRFLGGRQIGYHFGDEQLLTDMGRVEKGRLRVGRCVYTTVVMPAMLNIERTTLTLLKRFVRAGGRIISLGRLPTCVDGCPDAASLAWLRASVITPRDHDEAFEILKSCGAVRQTLTGQNTDAVRLMRRSRRDGDVLYMVNLDTERTASFTLTTAGSTLRRLDMETVREEHIPFTALGGNVSADLTLAPKTSMILQLDGAAPLPAPTAIDRPTFTVTVPDTLAVTSMSDNALTLDACEYRIDGGDWQPKKAVIRLGRELLELRRPCDVEMRFSFTVDCDPARLGGLSLVCETVERLDVTLNGHKVVWNGKDRWLDASFCKCDVTGLVERGENVVLIKARYFQREEVYDVLFGEDPMHAKKNKLTYDTELESIYLVGRFGVFCPEGFTSGERNALFAPDHFVIREAPVSVRRGSLTEQGLAFFAGRVTLSFDADVPADAGRVLLSYRQRAAVTHITINGRPVRDVLWALYETDVTDFIHPGQNRISVELVSGSRCLLGPHHYIDGESYFVGPATFTDRGGWSDIGRGGQPIWRDDWCFVTFGIG